MIKIFNTKIEISRKTKQTIVVFSDSHYDDQTLRMAIADAAKNTENIIAAIHLGDCVDDVDVIREAQASWQIFSVRGNNDYFHSETPDQIFIDAGSVRILATHGHRFSSLNSSRELVEYSKAKKVSVACFGHTHRQYKFVSDGVTLLNPGSCAYPRGSSKKGYATITLTDERYYCELHQLWPKLGKSPSPYF